LNTEQISPVRHGLILGILALMMGALWAAYMANSHEVLHGGFEAEQAAMKEKQMQQMMSQMDMSNMDMGHSHAEPMPANHHDAEQGHAHAGKAHEHGGHSAGGQHSHTGSLPNDAMQRLLRGHIHAMGLGVLVCILLLITTFTSLKDIWKKTLGWSLGLGAVLYPPAWVIMGFRTVALGPEAAEASIMWLFLPAVALLVGSIIAVLIILILEEFNLRKHVLFSWLFD